MILGLALSTALAWGLAEAKPEANYLRNCAWDHVAPWWDGGAALAAKGVLIDGARWRMVWDEATRCRVSREDFGYASYGRMIELRGGDLLCVYEADGSVFAVRSKDGGSTWSAARPVAWAQKGIAMTAPEVLELADGSLLACYNARPHGRAGGPRTFAIRTRKSFDGGRTWKRGRLVYEAGMKFGDGCWEPAAVQMPDGEIRLFFADEGSYRRTHEQNISMVRSRDGGQTWSRKPEIVSFYKGARDGMPVPLVLPASGKVVCAMEMLTPAGELQPAMLWDVGQRGARPIDRWDERRGWPINFDLGNRVYAGAPYLQALGTTATVMSYQGSEGRRRGLYGCDMKVVVGNSEARNFGARTAPFAIPRDRFALWNSLCVTSDGSVIALSSTNGYTPRAQIWMIRGRLEKIDPSH